jgi:hypothetical protein
MTYDKHTICFSDIAISLARSKLHGNKRSIQDPKNAISLAIFSEAPKKIAKLDELLAKTPNFVETQHCCFGSDCRAPKERTFDILLVQHSSKMPIHRFPYQYHFFVDNGNDVNRD